MKSIDARFCVPVVSFMFNEEPPVEPKPPEPAVGGIPPKPPQAQVSEPKEDSIEVRMAKLKTDDPKLFATLFGRGIKKGIQDTAKENPLNDAQAKAAKTLFEKVKPEDIAGLLKAKEDATNAALAKAKAEQDFTTFTKQMEDKHHTELQAQTQASETQLSGLKELVDSQKQEVAKLRNALQDIKITQELISAAKQNSFIDPSDAVAQLASKLELDADLEIVERNAVEKVPVNLGSLIAELIKTKPHLVASHQRAGEGGPGQTPPVSPGGNPDLPVFKRSQLSDAKFFQKNKVAIMKAHREGRIIDDISNPTK